MGLGICCLLLALGLLRASAAQAARRGLEDDLPAAFDWRNAGKVTPVRDAGECAASQAFSATAMLESAVAIESGQLVDLSEQYLLSCGGGTVTCMDGGWDVHDYHSGLFNPPQQSGGAVLESAMRYRAAVTPCTRVAAHPYQILRWGYVNPAGASAEEIQPGHLRAWASGRFGVRGKCLSRLSRRRICDGRKPVLLRAGHDHQSQRGAGGLG